MAKLTPGLRLALEDCSNMTKRGGYFYWRPKTMLKLADMGLVEKDGWPPQRFSHNELRHSYRPTKAGRAALKETP